MPAKPPGPPSWPPVSVFLFSWNYCFLVVICLFTSVRLIFLQRCDCLSKASEPTGPKGGTSSTPLFRWTRSVDPGKMVREMACLVSNLQNRSEERRVGKEC